MNESFSLTDLPTDCLFLVLQQVPFVQMFKLKRGKSKVIFG